MLPKLKGSLDEIGLPRIYQLGIIVNDIDRAVNTYARIFGLEKWYRGEVRSQETIFKNKRIEMAVDMVFAYSDKLMIELIGLMDDGDNIYSEYLRENGEGLHHLGIEVKDYDRKFKALSEMGFEVIQHGTLVSKGGAVSRMAYFDTREELGYPIELMETKLFGLPVGKSEFMMKVGCTLGDATKVKP